MKPAAKKGDTINANDIHIVITPSGALMPVTLPFVGVIDGALAPTVLIEHRPAAVDASTATNIAPHFPPIGTFQTPPSNRASVLVGGGTVLANHKLLARHGDIAMTCNDPADAPLGVVVASGTVLVG